MYWRGCDIILFYVCDLSIPEAAILNQKWLKQDNLVKKWPFVRGPQKDDIKGNKIPIFNSTGAFTSLHTRSYMSGGSHFFQLYGILKVFSCNQAKLHISLSYVHFKFYSSNVHTSVNLICMYYKVKCNEPIVFYW